jgi:heme-degrading monooxygenase HmoA
MLVMTRVRVPEGEGAAFRTRAEDLLGLLAGMTGFVRGHLGRAVDEPDLWVLSTEWDGVGAYRRALSSYDVKLTAPEALAHAVQEPSAYEVLASR